MKKIVLVAGGTGGHFFSALALGEELLAKGHEVHFITDLRCQKYIPDKYSNVGSKLSFHILDLKKPPRSFTDKIGFCLDLLIVTCKATKLLRSLKALRVVGFGGYPVVPVMFAAIFLRIPIIIHEQNSCFGKVNRFFARFARKIALAYKHTHNLPAIAMSKIVVTGGIVREDIRNKRALKVRNDVQNFRIFIFGGSQGAKLFSDLIPASIKILVQKNPELKLTITQQAAAEDQNKIDKIYSELNIDYKLEEFFKDIGDQYQNTDLIISRAGASTIEELSYIGLPAIFIPLPNASENHQYYNAKLLEDDEASWCLEQKSISAEKLADKILWLISNQDILIKASQNLLKRKNEWGHKLISLCEQDFN